MKLSSPQALLDAKICVDCKVIKPLVSFYYVKKENRYFAHCRACANIRSNKWRKAHPKAACEIMYRWRTKNPTYMSRFQKAARARYRKHAQQYKEKYRLLHHDRAYAQGKIAYAVKTGKLVAPIACQWCNKVCKLQAHHRDYTKVLEVEWICPKCHVRETLSNLNRLRLTLS